MDAKFKLIPEEIPPIRKGSLYEDVLASFVRGKAKTARVEVAKRKPDTVQQGLIKARAADPKLAEVSIVRRGDLVYLKK
ncbi:MAG: hypothetical protein WC971_00775 [Coriobacteriia bacterium]